MYFRRMFPSALGLPDGEPASSFLEPLAGWAGEILAVSLVVAISLSICLRWSQRSSSKSKIGHGG